MDIKCSECGCVFEKYSSRYMCKSCNRDYNTINKENIKLYNKKRYESNKHEILKKIKKYHEINNQQIKKYIKQWFHENKEYINEFNRKKYSENINFKIKVTLRNTLNKKLKNKKTTSSIKLLGCSVEYFKNHLEQQFLPEMSWENHGIIWEIDHIKPCASFDLTDLEQQKQCFHYTNLQPLFKTTEIAESFGYINQIGNRNKNKNVDQRGGRSFYDDGGLLRLMDKHKNKGMFDVYRDKFLTTDFTKSELETVREQYLDINNVYDVRAYQELIELSRSL